MKPTQPIRDVLTGPERWTKHAAARDSAGNHVNSRAPGATCWCLSGAMALAGAPLNAHPATLIALHKREAMSVPYFNDAPSTTFDDVLAFLDDMDKALS